MSGLCYSYASKHVLDKAYTTHRTKIIVLVVMTLNTVVLGFTSALVLPCRWPTALSDLQYTKSCIG